MPNYKSRFPPLWFLPTLLTKIVPMARAQKRGDYLTAMKIGRQVMGSANIKTRAFKEYTPTEHDVFVCTYSKSGTYWMMQIVMQIAGLGSAEFEHIHDLVPWPEAPMPGLAKLSAPTWQSTLTQRRAVKTHAEAQFVPYNNAAKYIIVIRDPKDALISGFYFADAIMPGLSSIGLDKWFDAFIKGEIPFGLWSDHVASFWPWRDRDNVLLVTFSEMKADLASIVQQVAALMAVELSDDQLAQVVERASFAYMKTHENKFNPPSPPGLKQKNMTLIRSGKEGESAELLTPEQLAHVDSEMKAQLIARGSDFPYNNYFA